MEWWKIKTLTSKDHEIIPEINEHKIDKYAFSETRKKGRETTKLNDYILIFPGATIDQRATSGVGIVIKDDVWHPLHIIAVYRNITKMLF